MHHLEHHSLHKAEELEVPLVCLVVVSCGGRREILAQQDIEDVVVSMVDDVGGIGGFCRMLKTIYEADIYDDESMDERDDMLDWAEMMGWTGRRISSRQTL